MANRDNVRTPIRGINPQALATMDLIDGELNDLGGLDSISVTLTEYMTREEQIMSLIEKYQNKGDTLAAAKHKAESVLTFLEHSSSSVTAVYFNTSHLGRDVRLNFSFLNDADRCGYGKHIYAVVSVKQDPCQL